MLREKWKDDLLRLFAIEADICNAGSVLSKLETARRSPNSTDFAIISSLEGLRPQREFTDGRKTSARIKVAQALREVSDNIEDPLLDLAVIDEAHYLKNPETRSHLLGRLLADASRHLVLLTATPVHVGSENLFNLLRLLDPEHYSNLDQFNRMLQANAPLVRAQSQIWAVPPVTQQAAESITVARESPYFEQDPVLSQIQQSLSAGANLGPSARVEIGRQLESRSLIGQHMTRSRKREVIKNRVQRIAQVLSVEFNEQELDVYEAVTQALRLQAKGRKGVALFSLISRQRQMASCLVAALRGWQESGVIESMMWDDLGMTSRTSSGTNEQLETADLVDLKNIDLVKLEKYDTKYLKLRDKFLTPRLKENAQEKLVIFAFFRGTLTYLQRRLEQDGFRTTLIMGASGGKHTLQDRKQALKDFAEPNGPQILLSSEVGSEGIDLQFCNIVVNYDLPWNPMKVEQRIGRIDRIGQKANKISVISLAVQNTIEDRIIMRLYQRIQLFKDSIGDLEEILGDVSEKLLARLFDSALTDEEREKIAAESELAIENQRAEQNNLEEQAINLIGFSDYLLDTVTDARELGRWLAPEELDALVEDYFQLYYPGTLLEPIKSDPQAKSVHLSSDARAKLSQHLNNLKTSRRTQLTRNRAVKCIFDPRRAGTIPASSELIEPTHPLITWIEAEYAASKRALHPCIAMKIAKSAVNLEPVTFAFACQRWSLSGIRREVMMAFRGFHIEKDGELDPLDTERLVVAASRGGIPVPPASVDLKDRNHFKTAYLGCIGEMENDFVIRVNDFELENQARCSQQITSAERLADRKVSELRERIERLKSEGRTRILGALEGQVRRQEELREQKLNRIAERQNTDITVHDLAGGFVIVTD